MKEEQYFAQMKFAKELEEYFKTTEGEKLLRFECRDGQHDRGSETKIRIVSTSNAIKAFAATYLERPHSTTRGFGDLRDIVGKQIFGEDHVPEPYYASSFALYLLETRFRTKAVDVAYKPARFLILLAARLRVDSEPPTQMNSREMAQRGEKFVGRLSTQEEANRLFNRAIEIFDQATESNLSRDHVRTKSITDRVLEISGRKSQKT